MKSRFTIPSLLLSATLFSESRLAIAQTSMPPKDTALIPAGPFKMGDAMRDVAAYPESPVNTVYISAFYMDKHEVTKALWDEVYDWAIQNGYDFATVGVGNGPNHPVLTFNWLDVLKWCNARSEKEGRTPAYYTSSAHTFVYRAGKVHFRNDWVRWDVGYRLPTEAEWEKAARGGFEGRRFPWGDTISHDQANYRSSKWEAYDISSVAGYHPAFDNSDLLHKTSPVGYFSPNGYGLYDVTGNAAEWCWDRERRYYVLPSEDNPRGPEPTEVGGLEEGISRGGSFISSAYQCRLSYRISGSFAERFSEIGFRCAFGVAVSEWRKAIQPTYGICPMRENGKNSLVLVTHGWQPAWQPVDIEWVATMTNAVSQYLVNQELNNWQVEAYRWVERARPAALYLVGGAKIALDNAKEEGVNLGKKIVNQEFAHVHLIAHSAGAGLIQAVLETIKALRSDIVVHLTFLDAFVGLDYGERDKYGKGADWSDSYFSRDFETSGGIYPFTEGPLDHAYNVDVTWLDTHRKEIQVSFSTSSGEMSQTCYQKGTSHGWPYQFYTGTVLPNTMFGSAGFGFPLSKEGGGWDSAVNQYQVGKNTLKVLGSGELSCVPNPSPNSLHMELPLDFSKLPGASVIMDSPEHVTIHGIDFTLKTASPAWLSFALPITNRVNLVSLGATFKSAKGAEGLLSVYWGTNVIGSVDERLASQGTLQYTFPIPETATWGTEMLGFRLDAFSAVQSSVTVTNVMLGFAGIREPFSLSFIGTRVSGLPLLQLTGPAGYTYRAESSINLLDWSTIALLVNTNGVVRFVDSDSTNATTRFYRAVAP